MGTIAVHAERDPNGHRHRAEQERRAGGEQGRHSAAAALEPVAQAVSDGRGIPDRIQFVLHQ